MKKLVLFFIICSLLLSSEPFEQISSDLKTASPIENYIETPRVLIQEIIDPIATKTVMTNLVKYAKDTTIEGIILVIDSAGGSESHFSAIHDLIKKITALKPIITFVLGNALSGGYMIASATNYIIAPNFSNIGSIGVIKKIVRYTNPKIKTTELSASLDVTLLRAGKYKALCDPYIQELTADDLSYLQENLQKSYQLFLNLISTNRKLDISRSSEWAEGKIFIGHYATEAGLIDQIGTYFDAEAKIIELIRAKNPDKQYTNTIIPVFA